MNIMFQLNYRISSKIQTKKTVEKRNNTGEKQSQRKTRTFFKNIFKSKKIL